MHKYLSIRFCGLPLIALLLGAPSNVTAIEPTLAPVAIEKLKEYNTVLTRMREEYVDVLNDNMLIEASIKGMVNRIDPEGEYLDREAFKELSGEASKNMASVGLEIGREDEWLKVVAPLDDSPAYYADIRSGDLIVEIDHVYVKNMTLTEGVSRLRGKPNTNVTVTVMRKGEDQPRDISLTRQMIKLQSVKSRMLETGYAYVRIARLQENTLSMLTTHLKQLYKLAEPKGLILDLRNNSGGLLHAAVGVAAIFLQPKAVVASMTGRTKDTNMILLAESGFYIRTGPDFTKEIPAGIKTVPLIVIVNHGSAAGAEIIAGALQDHQRAIIIGQPTFGRATLQTIMPLQSGAALKLTTAHWHTPRGRSVRSTGIVPDVVFPEQRGIPGTSDYLDEVLVILKKRQGTEH